mmetsp:Transcript_21483/g.50075  ORF Transcript_21483/g.50075 Transcript_21483/m.50075 type:complete len:769 (-) Transcript_21483:86-2392(-)
MVKRKQGSARKKQAPDQSEAADAEQDEAPPPKKGKWKPVELGLDLLKEFEASGGFMLEEADENEVGVAYADAGMQKKFGSQAKQQKGKGQKLEKPPKKSKSELKEENRKLQEELAALKAGKSAGDKVVPGKAKIKAKKASASPMQVAATPVPVEERAPLQASELVDWQEFDLHPTLLGNIAKLRFAKPTEVQRRCLHPAIRQRKDLIGAAETGSGKTLAFGLPILHHILTAEDPTGSAALQNEEASGQKTKSGLSAIAILPTRELAVQVKNHIAAAAQGTPIRCECVVGGMSVQKQHRLLNRGPRIVVGTPGRLFALLGLNKEAEQERCEWFRSNLAGLRHLVLDEADRLVESGHFRELDKILSLLYSSLERAQQLQTFVFSATLTLDPRSGRRRAGADSDENAKLDALIQRLQFREARAVHVVDLTKPEHQEDAPEIQTKRRARLPKGLMFGQVTCDGEKDRESKLAVWLLHRYRWHAMTAKETVRQMRGAPELPSSDKDAARKGGRVILFTNAVSAVMRLAPVLALLMESPSAEQVLAKVGMSYDKTRGTPPGGKVEVIGLHSRLRQKDRLKKIEKFRASKAAVLVCTDVAARGLDVPEVAAVLHYQPPRNVEVFIHRSGRTARAGRDGESVAFATPADLSQWSRVYNTVGIDRAEVEEFSIGAFDVPAAREAIRLASTLESKVHKSSKESSDESWFKRAAEEAELIFDDDDDDRESAKPVAPKKAFWGLYQRLIDRVRWLPKQLGAAPLRKKGRLQKVRGKAKKR